MRFYYKRLFILMTGQVALLFLFILILGDIRLLTMRSAALNWLAEKDIMPCMVRKLPTVIEHGSSCYYIVWETSCSERIPSIEWWSDHSDKQNLPHIVIDPLYKELDSNHHRYSAIIGPISDDTARVNYRVRSASNSGRNWGGWRGNTYTIKRKSRPSLHRLLVLADNQNRPSIFRTVLSAARKIYGTSSKPDSVLHVGDSVQMAESLSDWQKQFFVPMEDIGGYLQTAPLIFIPGNHDHDKRRGPNNSNYYMDMYHGLPDTESLKSEAVVNGSYHRFYHTFEVGPAMIIVLDSECPSPEQSEFLRNELRSSAFQNAEFRIVAVHIPPYIEFWDPDSWEKKGEKYWGRHIREEYDPLFREYNVDLVISGHQHNYQRGTVMRDPENSGSGNITYAIVGGAGGDLDLERIEQWNMYSSTYLDHHFVTLDIANATLSWTAYDVDGSVIDEFTIER